MSDEPTVPDSGMPPPAEPNPFHLREGDSVASGRYQLVRQLGEGGMGQVWLAVDSELQDKVALKFLPPQIRSDPRSLDFLRQEVISSRRLAHPNIVKIHDIVTSQNSVSFISMEYVEGNNLATLQSRMPRQIFGWEYIKPWIAQLGTALAYAHEKKVIHRDLKPANVLIDENERVRLADFGIARSMADTSTRADARRSASGTLSYMSPQQLEGKNPKPTDDIYSFGATLYELLSGRPPFYTGEMVHQILFVEAQPLQQRLADFEITNPIPPEVRALIASCLAKNPAGRPQTMHEALTGLGIDGGELVGQPRRGRRPPPSYPVPEIKEWVDDDDSHRRKTSPWPALLGVLLITGALGGALYWARDDVGRLFRTQTASGAAEKPSGTTGTPGNTPNEEGVPPDDTKPTSTPSPETPNPTTPIPVQPVIKGPPIDPPPPNPIAPSTPEGTVKVQTDIQRASFEVRTSEDQRIISVGPLEGPVLVPPGNYLFSLLPAAGNRGVPIQQSVVVRDGQTVPFSTGSVTIDSRPELGASVIHEGKVIGKTPLRIDLATGQLIQFGLRKERHEPLTTEPRSIAKDGNEWVFDLKPAHHPLPDEEYQNTLGMRFIQVGDLKDVWFAVTETTRAEFNEFHKATFKDGGKFRSPDPADIEWTKASTPPGVREDRTLPVTRVSLRQARRFCEWLTEVEQANGKLARGYRYRLPQDVEWSAAAGVQGERGETPAERLKNGQIDPKLMHAFPWGNSPQMSNLKPPADFANYGFNKASKFPVIVGKRYGSPHPLQHLFGNVWELCDDPFDAPGAVASTNRRTEAAGPMAVARGGSYFHESPMDHYRLISRFTLGADDRHESVGFRVVCVKRPPNDTP